MPDTSGEQTNLKYLASDNSGSSLPVVLDAQLADTFLLALFGHQIGGLPLNARGQELLALAQRDIAWQQELTNALLRARNAKFGEEAFTDTEVEELAAVMGLEIRELA